MQPLTQQPHMIYLNIAKAEALASRLNADASSEKYVVLADAAGPGRAVIAVYDEDGNYVFNL